MERKEKGEEIFPIPRLYLILIFLIASIVVCASGTFMPVDVEYANQTAQEFEKAKEYITTVPYIFGNNFMHCLIMFVPVAGIAYGMFVLFNTGYHIAMFAIVEEYPPALVFLSYFLLPFFWMEFISFAIAMSESTILTFRLLKGEFRSKLHETCKWIAICALILLASAFIEVIMILAVGG